MELSDHFIALVIPFPLDGPLPVKSPAGWVRSVVAPSPAFVDHLAHKYYPHFLSCMHPAAAPGSAAQLHVYEAEQAKVMRVGDVPAALWSIELRSFDAALGMCTVLVRMEGTALLDQLHRLAGALREPATPVLMDGRSCSLMDVLAEQMAHWAVSKERLVAFGPNFKVFVNAVLRAEELQEAGWDSRLFELANGIPLGGMSEPSAPTASYGAEQVALHGVKLFNNWRALALFDTFTRLALRGEDPHRIWALDYLRIFQYVHMLRAQALAVTARLAHIALADVSLLDERDRWMDLRNNVDLRFVSYKWLPNELFSRMMSGTNALHEIHRADERLERMVLRFKERRSRNLARAGLVLLGLIAVLLLAFSGLF